MPETLKTEQLNKIREIVRKMVRERMIDEMNTTGNIEGYNTPFAFSGKDGEKKKAKKQADLTGYTPVNENRWLALKQDESTAQAKIGRGISNINKQLKEMENDTLVKRKVIKSNPITVEYYLTQFGSSSLPIIRALIKWGSINKRKMSSVIGKDQERAIDLLNDEIRFKNLQRKNFYG